MDASSIDLPGSEVESLSADSDRLIVRFSRAFINKTMTGSDERTRWWQSGRLEFEGGTLQGKAPELPAVCSGGDVGENIYTYRDMIPIPLESRGTAHCDLGFVGCEERLVIQARGVRLVMDDRPHYIEHLRP